MFKRFIPFSGKEVGEWENHAANAKASAKGIAGGTQTSRLFAMISN